MVVDTVVNFSVKLVSVELYSICIIEVVTSSKLVDVVVINGFTVVLSCVTRFSVTLLSVVSIESSDSFCIEIIFAIKYSWPFEVL